MNNPLQQLTLRQLIDKSRIETEVKSPLGSAILRRDFLKA